GRDVLGHLFAREGHELGDDVPVSLPKRAVGGLVFHVADDGGDALGQGLVTHAAVEDADLVAGGDRQLDAGQRDLAGAADEENVECHDVCLPLPHDSAWAATVMAQKRRGATGFAPRPWLKRPAGCSGSAGTGWRDRTWP